MMTPALEGVVGHLRLRMVGDHPRHGSDVDDDAAAAAALQHVSAHLAAAVEGAVQVDRHDGTPVLSDISSPAAFRSMLALFTQTSMEPWAPTKSATT
jgi:hypothetical protein